MTLNVRFVILLTLAVGLILLAGFVFGVPMKEPCANLHT